MNNPTPLFTAFQAERMLLKSLPITMILLFLTTSVMGQLKVDPRVIQETKVTELMQMSEDLARQAQEDFDRAQAAALQNGWPIREEYDDGVIIQLIRLDEDGLPVYYKTNNAVSSALLNTDDVQALGLTGAGINIGEWDGGDVRSSHEQYSGRVTNNDGVGISSHATHVCGTIIGDGTGNASAMGMAPGATVDGYDFNNDVAEMAAEAAGGMILSNHSYGTISGWFTPSGCGSPSWYGNPATPTESDNFGQYDVQAQQWDMLANNAPFYLRVKSAGNDRGDTGANGTDSHRHNSTMCSVPTEDDSHPVDGGATGFDCIPTYGNAKNIITVGALTYLI